jgi:hypothetical protein
MYDKKWDWTLCPSPPPGWERGWRWGNVRLSSGRKFMDRTMFTKGGNLKKGKKDIKVMGKIN